MDGRIVIGGIGFIFCSEKGLSEKYQIMVNSSLHTGLRITLNNRRPSDQQGWSCKAGALLSFFTFGLMMIIVFGGIGGRYARKVKMVRDYWRSLHIPLTAIFYVTLGIHILLKTGLLQ